MKAKTFVIVDTETTGLRPGFHEVIEIGAVRAKLEKDLFGKALFTKVDEREWKIIPEYLERADPGALKVNGYNERDWSTAIPKRTAYEQFHTYANNCIFIAQNVTFDWSFLDEESRSVDIELGQALYYRKLDLASIALGKHFKEDGLERYTLKELAAFFDVRNPDAHTALADAQTAFQICKKLFEN